MINFFTELRASRPTEEKKRLRITTDSAAIGGMSAPFEISCFLCRRLLIHNKLYWSSINKYLHQ